MALIYVMTMTPKKTKVTGNGDDDDDDDDRKGVPVLKYRPYEPRATVWTDLQVLRAMWFARITGTDLQERLDSFYERQADLYDSYRFRMLHGRPIMLQAVARHLTTTLTTTASTSTSTSTTTDVDPAATTTGKDDATAAGEAAVPGIVWVDLACGTGANTENFASSLLDGTIGRVYLVDLCRPLCAVARRDRGNKFGHARVRVLHGDATDFDLEGLPPPGSVDLVTISYSLVMIPDWRKCIANARRLLKPGRGILGVADFTVAPDQGTLSKRFWTDTFRKDHVFLSPDHLPALREEFEELESAHGHGTLPYTPSFLRPAYYHFVGRCRPG